MAFWDKASVNILFVIGNLEGFNDCSSGFISLFICCKSKWKENGTGSSD